MNAAFNFAKTLTVASDDLYGYSTLDYPDIAPYSRTGNATIWIIIALVLAIVGGILIYFLFVNKKGEPKGKFAAWLKKFLDFKIMWIEAILKILYYIGTIFMVLASFAMISTDVLSFFLTLILGPVVIRLVYEAFMILIMIWRNTKDIAENTKKK